jgi:hypothetical protein
MASKEDQKAKVKRGRPPTWHSKIQAPLAAIALYEMIADLQNTDAFRTCHVYSGAVDKKTGLPMFKFEGRVHAMPYVISSYMGIEYGKRICNTDGCVNPFHYAPPSERVEPSVNHFQAPQAAGSDWNDLVDYYVEEVGVPLDYSKLRAAIPAEDIDDANLRTAVLNYKPLR